MNRCLRARSPLFFLLLLFVPACGLVGCAGGGLLLRPAPAGEAALWQLPASSYPSQRLYRVQYQGPEGKASFRLTLYLGGEGLYRMEASDTLGRRAWSLGVEPDAPAVFLDHREELYCTARGGGEQDFVPIAHLPLRSLPRLILGRMPVEPAGQVDQAEGKISYVDERGQLWNGESENGLLRWWSLLVDGEAVAWWRSLDDRFIFSDRRGGQQVTWSEQVRESLEQAPAPLEVPQTYREGVCGSTLD